MTRLTPLIKGLITGALMIAISFFLYYKKITNESSLGYIVYAIYAAGIFWTLWEYSRYVNPASQFGELFGQGFRCFVVVTLVMVIFTYVYLSAHPEIASDSALQYKEAMIKEGSKGSKTPDDIEKTAENYKKHYVTNYISVTSFGTLIMGVIFTAAGAGLLIMRRK